MVLFDVTFWGVRGSRPVPGSQTIRFGGNTSCVQMQLGDRMFIFDAGTGICSLAQFLSHMEVPIKGEIFITHTHWDHIQGFPFFTPAFQEENQFILYGERKNKSFETIIKGTMHSPHFPVQLEEMGAHIAFKEVEENSILDMGEGIQVTTFRTIHPNGCLAYRVDYQGLSCCYLTDYEHGPDWHEDTVSFVQECDLLIFDSHFTDDEYKGLVGFPDRKGWGHSTWQEGVKLAQDAQVKSLSLFHHGTHRTDDDMEEIEKRARHQFHHCFAAREGMSVSL